MEIPAEFVNETENKNLYDQRKEKTLEEVEKFEERKKLLWKKRFNIIYFLPLLVPHHLIGRTKLEK